MSVDNIIRLFDVIAKLLRNCIRSIAVVRYGAAFKKGGNANDVFLIAQVWIPPAAQMYQPTRNYPWGVQPPIVQPQRPPSNPSVTQPTVYREAQPSRVDSSNSDECKGVKGLIDVFGESAERYNRAYEQQQQERQF